MLAQNLKLMAPVSLRDRLKPWLPKSTAPPADISPAQREAADALIAARVKGFTAAESDPGRGKLIFQQQCAVCHRVNREGGLIGPQLDGIGSRGLARLCEDTLDPNRNVDIHFRLTKIELTKGSALTGFIVAEQGQSIQMRDIAGQVHRLSNSEIKSRKNLPVSLMPAVFGHTIPETDFYDLVSWLLNNTL